MTTITPILRKIEANGDVIADIVIVSVTRKVNSYFTDF